MSPSELALRALLLARCGLLFCRWIETSAGHAVDGLATGAAISARDDRDRS